MTKAEKLAKAKKDVPVPVIEDDISTENEESSVVSEEETVETKPEKKSSKKDCVTFRLRNGQIREFTREIHGDDFEKIAEAFKNNGKKLVIAVL